MTRQVVGSLIAAAVIVVVTIVVVTARLARPSCARSARSSARAAAAAPAEGPQVPAATLTVEQTAQRTRTFFVMYSAAIEAASTLPHSTQT